MHWEATFRHHAMKQEGVLGIDQLPALGCTGDHWRHAKRSGRWDPLSRRVIRLAGTRPTDSQRAHAAILDAGGGAVLHAGSALAWVGLRGFDLAQPHVVRRRGTTSAPSALAVVHRLRDLDDGDIITVRGVDVVRPIRAIWSEASRYSASWSFEHGLKRIARVLDDAHRLGLVRWDELHQSIDRLGRPGRAGTTIMRAAGVRRQPGSSPTESRLEDRFESVLADAGSPPLQRQPVVGGCRPIGRSDHRDPDLPVVVEVNSLTFHSTPSDEESDEDRYTALVEAGFCVAVIWEPALWSDTGSVVAAVTEARRRARRGERVVIHTTGCPWPHDPDRIVAGRPRPPYRG